MTVASRLLTPLIGSMLLLAACGNGGSASRAASAQGRGDHGSGDSAVAAPGASGDNPASSGLPTIPPVLGATQAPSAGTTTAAGTSTHSPTPTTPRETPPPPSPASGGGSCPDPRYCAAYNTLPGDAAWPRDGSGRATVHYRINPSRPGSPTTLSDSQVIAAVQQLAQAWSSADAAIAFAYDGTTTDQAVGFNDVVGFTAAAANANVNIPVQVSSDGHTITGFNIQLSASAMWLWQPCDGASTPCDPYPGTGVDLGSMLAHAWGHAIGLGDLGDAADRLLTNAGGISAGPDCGGGGQPVCRFAVTLGLGDVLGARHLYPTPAPMPRIAYDQ